MCIRDSAKACQICLQQMLELENGMSDSEFDKSAKGYFTAVSYTHLKGKSSVRKAA